MKIIILPKSKDFEVNSVAEYNKQKDIIKFENAFVGWAVQVAIMPQVDLPRFPNEDRLPEDRSQECFQQLDSFIKQFYIELRFKVRAAGSRLVKFQD